MPITKELLQQALSSSHAMCDTKEGCIHANAFAGAMEDAEAGIQDAVMSAMMMGDLTKVPFSIFFSGVHAGYRLHQLETTPAKEGN